MHEALDIEEQPISGEVRLTGQITIKCIEGRQLKVENLTNARVPASLVVMKNEEEQLWIELPVKHTAICKVEDLHNLAVFIQAMSLESFKPVGDDLTYSTRDKVRFCVMVERINNITLGYSEVTDDDLREMQLMPELVDIENAVE